MWIGNPLPVVGIGPGGTPLFLLPPPVGRETGEVRVDSERL